MKHNGGLGQGVFFRLLLSVALAAAALVLFFLSKPQLTQTDQQQRLYLNATLTQIDLEVESILGLFGIEKEWVRKRQIPVPNSNLLRIERRVAIPPDVLPVQMNLAFNSMAHRYSARAVGTENTKERTVTIHIELQNMIVQTIILKTKRDLKRKDQRNIQIQV